MCKKSTPKLFTMCIISLFTYALYASDDADSTAALIDTAEITTVRDSSMMIDSAATPFPSIIETPQKLNDSLPITLHGTFFELGAGVLLGSIPVYQLWGKSLPDSLSRFGISPYTGAIVQDSTPNATTTLSDTAELTYLIKERPNVYNMTFPVRFGFRHITPEYFLGAGASFSFVSKQFASTISARNDTLGPKIDFLQSFSLYSFMVDFTYSHTISNKFFSIDKVDKSSFFIGVAAGPYSHLGMSTKTRLHGTSERFSAIQDSLLAYTRKLESHGVALSFRTGISTTRSLSQSSAICIDLLYSGDWHGRFQSGDTPVYNTDINPLDRGTRKLSFLSHRIGIQASFLFRPSRAKNITPGDQE